MLESAKCAPWGGEQTQTAKAKYEIFTVVNEFGKGSLDEVWIPKAAGWNPKPIVISGDVKRVTMKTQRQIVADSGMTWFCLSAGWTNTKFDDYVAKFLKVWPSILEKAKKTRSRKTYAISVKTLKIEEL